MRFATLCHDLGKAATPVEELPRHIGHEARGLAAVEGLCRRLRVPNDHRDLALLATRLHTLCHRALELRPATLLKVLKQADALRRPQRFEELLLTCTADYRGRAGQQNHAYPQADRLRRALAAIDGVDSAPLAAQGLAGPAFATALDERRIQAIRQSLPDSASGNDED